MSFVSITAQIKAILLTIPEIGEVHDYDKDKLDKYPAAVVFASENTSDFATTTQNQREYVFTIRIHQEMEKRPRTDVERIMRETVDAAVSKFDNNYTLNGAVNFCRATPSAWGYQTRQAGILRVAEIRLACIKLITI